MIYRRAQRFHKAFRSLPEDIQAKAVKAFALFQTDRQHPSLGIKKIKGADEIWEGRVDRAYRFTFHYETNPDNGEVICVFRNIDHHDECLKNP
jgi:mRNA-degrading endonuclease RelE of RelBE toxin-antitoxin system